MNEVHFNLIAKEMKLDPKRVLAAVLLLDGGATVPFIARYRKELTDTLDEVRITDIRDRINQRRDLDKRRDAIIKSLEERKLLTETLKKKVMAAESLTVLEDIYLPYRPKKRTKATVAKEKGLEPLAKLIFEQTDVDLIAATKKYVNKKKGVEGSEDALAGARDIVAEWMNEDQGIRAKMRELFAAEGLIRSKVCKGKEKDGIKYKDYYEWEEKIATAPSHRILAIRRGESEGFLMARITPLEEDAVSLMDQYFVKNSTESAQQVKLAAHDGYKRLLSVGMETEVRLSSKKRADEEAITVFVENLRQLLLASPLGEKNVLAIDPGFRTGCKVVAINKQGKFLFTEVIYPHGSEFSASEATEAVVSMCKKYEIEAIAVGNGTAGRETEAFVRDIKALNKIPVILVNESGASIYSASAVAREEFPDQDLTVRGAVSIGRRLMDPLSELVKIDAKSIGVGQYQHDVDQNALKNSLDDVVVSCVNAVGVEVNTSSKQLLTYVSGVGPKLAQLIIEYRNENGPFTTRKELLKVSTLGPKVFEQAAGFLRIRGAKNKLDCSAVHPESYHVVEAMAKDLGSTVTDIISDSSLQNKIDLKKYVTDTVGLPTLQDIVKELAKPGRDPRKEFEEIKFQDGVTTMDDLKVGMKLTGVITNITAFGAFVDIGVHQDGLVHISQMSDGFVKSPADVVKVQQKVTVTVMEIDKDRKRIALSMKTKLEKDFSLKKDHPKKASPSQKSDSSMSDFGKKLMEAALKSQ